jgi:ribosomal protein S27E
MRRWEMVRGPHGQERTGEPILRVLCGNCDNRVIFEPGEDEVKCPHCGNMVKRPKKEK